MVPRLELTLKVPTSTQSNSSLASVMFKERANPGLQIKVDSPFLLFLKPHIKAQICLFKKTHPHLLGGEKADCGDTGENHKQRQEHLLPPTPTPGLLFLLETI